LGEAGMHGMGWDTWDEQGHTGCPQLGWDDGGMSWDTWDGPNWGWGGGGMSWDTWDIPGRWVG